MTHHYVRIEAASSQGSTSSGSTAPLVPKRRRIGVTLACDACRRKKIRCGGSKPSCSSCLKAGIVCNYFEPGLIESENARDASILQRLRNLPSAEAGRLFEIIHTNKQGDSLTTCPSLATVLWSYVSPSRNKLELELMVRHPISYPPLVPLEAASLSFDSVLRPSRIFVTQQETGSVSQKYSPPYTSSPCHFSNEVRVRYFPPTPPSNDILLDLKIQQWTNVRIDNELAASILSHYIETDYQVLPMFDLDLFVENLILNKPYFCSKFLVSSLFSWICQSYSTILPEASDLGKDFFVEAQTLIPDGPQLVTLTAVSALQFLSLAAISFGHDRLGLEYLQKGVTIGTNMGLFNRHYGHGAASTWLGNEQDWRRSASYTAWGVYNRVSLHNLRYRLNEIGEPPRIAMPGTNGIGPSTENAIPEEASLHTQVFKASCELWVLSYHIHQARQRSHSAHSDFVAEAQAMFLRLLSWAGSLPVALVRHDQTNHAVAMMHIYFHVIIVDMFREVSHRSDEPFVMSSFDTRCIYPRAVYAASINQLKRLLLAFRISFPMAHYSILSQIVLIYVGNAVLLQEEGKEQSECQFYLRVCFAGLEDLYGSYRQVWGVMKGLLSMSLKRDAINPDEAERIMREMMILGQHHDNSEETTSSAIMDLELAVIDPSAAQVNCLAAQFDDLMLTVKAKV